MVIRSSHPASTAAAAEKVIGDHYTFGDSGCDGYNGCKLQHIDAVVSVACIKPDLALSGSKDKCVVLYDYKNKKQLNRWDCHSSAITRVLYGAASNKIFSSSRDKTIKLWHKDNLNVEREFSGHSLVVTAIHVNSSNSYLCSGSRDNTVKLWDIESGSCLKSNNIPQNLVTDLKFMPGDATIVQTGEDKEVRVFDTRTLQPVFSFPKKQYIQMCCDVDKSGHYIISSSNGFSGNGCELTLWDMRTRKLHKEFFGHREAVEACMFVPGTQQLASASRDLTVKIWNMSTGVIEAECILSGCGPLTSLAANDDGSLLVGSFNQGVQLLQLQNNSLTKLMHF
ncbi:WD repeat-containing protein 31-like [Physella acuta]|uniref:WD repeat-containing protein 31-like n=1 Tax=Physella acuta TaxID=109671 RepID=UPI0027DB10BE|nr:WD repeat-containing protein 31-like [Physella acuta]